MDFSSSTLPETASNCSQHRNQGAASVAPSTADMMDFFNSTLLVLRQATKEAECKRFHFLDMPAEIRNRVYTHCFSFTTPTAEFSCDEEWQSGRAMISPELSYEARSVPVNSSIASLLSTCHRVYAEAMPLLYEQTTFVVSAVSTHDVRSNPHRYPNPDSRRYLSPLCAPLVRNISLKRRLSTPFSSLERVASWMESIPAAFCGAFPSLKTLVIGIPTIRVSWKVLWVAEYVHLLKGGEANYEERMGFLERAVKKMRRDGCVFPECVQLELRLPFGQGGDWVRGCRYCWSMRPLMRLCCSGSLTRLWRGLRGWMRSLTRECDGFKERRRI